MQCFIFHSSPCEMTSNTKLGTNLGCEVWLPARFSGKTSKLSVLFSQRSCMIPGLATSCEDFFFSFLLSHWRSKRNKYLTGHFEKNTYFVRKLVVFVGEKNIANEQFRWRNKVAVYLTTTLKHSINSAWFQEISHNYLKVKIQPVYIS